MKFTPIGAQAQQSHGPTIIDIWRNPAQFRVAIECVEETRGRDAHARHLQVICLFGRHMVNSFWCAPIHFSMKGIEHDGDGKALGMIGLGPWFLPIVSDVVIAGCVLPTDRIVRSPNAWRSLLDLQPLNAVADWLQREVGLALLT